MKQTYEQIRRNVEGHISGPQSIALNQTVCDLTKAGAQIPPVEDVLKMMAMISVEEVEFGSSPWMVLKVINTGLSYLAQLAIASERM